MVRAERSELCICAYIEKRPGQKVNTPTDATDNTCELKPTSAVASLRQIDEFSRSEMELDLLPGGSRGYWKYHAPGKWFQQAKAVGKINNEKAKLLFDSGAEVSIIDPAFAHKIGFLGDSGPFVSADGCQGLDQTRYLRLSEGDSATERQARDLASTGRGSSSSGFCLGRIASVLRVAEPCFRSDDRSATSPDGRRTTRRPDGRAPAVRDADEDRETACARPETGGVSDSEAGCPVDRKAPEIVKEERLHDRGAGPPTEMLSEPAIPSTQSDHLIDTAPTRDPTISTSEHPVALKSEQHMALLPEVVSTTDEGTIEDIQAGDPEFNTPEEARSVISTWEEQRQWSSGCDSAVAPQFREKLSQQIKGLLSAKIIQSSTSPWASPIVIIIKKNGVDIRLCVDYRLVNSLTRLMVYPIPLINDLLEDLDMVLWYCSLDMASGFWVWLRMPFGLKNGPQIYQRLVDNALYGHLNISANADSAFPIDVFKDGEPETDQKPSVLGRRSYIDDILVTASGWDVLCEKVKKLLEACDRWNLSIRVVKRFWGLRKVDYLGHRVSVDGFEAHPKDLKSLANLPFPRTMRSMQIFLESLNYYSRFIEDFAIYAAVLYELREASFHEIRVKEEIKPASDPQLIGDGRSTVLDDRRGEGVMIAFTMLKAKIASTPALRHFDPDRAPVVVVYASKWAIFASLMQKHDGVYWPVIFTSRTLKSNDINYGIVGKEVLALLRILDVCYTLLVTRSIKVLTRHSTLAWLVHSSGFNGRLGRCAALSSSWTLEVRRSEKGDDEILGTIAASITPREEVDEVLTAIAPKKLPRQTVSMPPPTVELIEHLLVVSFYGSARVTRGFGAYGAIVWKLSGWEVLAAAFEYAPDVTVNEADADRLTSTALQKEEGAHITSDEDRQDLVTLNRLDELLMPKFTDQVAQVTAVTRSAWRRRLQPETLHETVVRQMRSERIVQAQNKEKWIADLKAYLQGNLADLTAEEVKACSRIADDYEVDDDGLLLYCPITAQSCGDREMIARLVGPETLHRDFLHHYHTSLEGGIRESGAPIDVLEHISTGEASIPVFSATWQNASTVRLGMGGRLLEARHRGMQATYPFQIVVMDTSRRCRRQRAHSEERRQQRDDDHDVSAEDRAHVNLVRLDSAAVSDDDDSGGMRVYASDGPPTADMLVDEMTQHVKRDSGARYSVAGTDWTMRGERKQVDAPVMCIEGIGGFLLDLQSVWTFSMVNVYGQKVTVDACIIEGSTNEFLVSVEFLDGHRAMMDFERKEVRYNERGHKVIIQFRTTEMRDDSMTAAVRLARSTNLHRRTVQSVEVAIAAPDGEEGIFLPTVNNGAVLLASTVTKVNNGKALIPAINTYGGRIRLPSRKELGVWIPMTSDIELLEMHGVLRSERVQTWLDELADTTTPLDDESE
ncbi:unnamed protein product [Phytophthora fragariaefolia]|uniref:Unnamed protein product n=1 Tax=Phytophthora fragariaefolia TaxID=1490495 RepID=A0A9W6UCL8_9STRA|nr:unnamed protein product [Phytophthora fragariaefolia]